jgi:hypothetical protein
MRVSARAERTMSRWHGARDLVRNEEGFLLSSLPARSIDDGVDPGSRLLHISHY